MTTPRKLGELEKQLISTLSRHDIALEYGPDNQPTYVIPLEDDPHWDTAYIVINSDTPKKISVHIGYSRKNDDGTTTSNFDGVNIERVNGISPWTTHKFEKVDEYFGVLRELKAVLAGRSPYEALPNGVSGPLRVTRNHIFYSSHMER